MEVFTVFLVLDSLQASLKNVATGNTNTSSIDL